MKKILILILPVFFISGCAQNLAPVFFMPQTVDTIATPVTDQALGDVMVTVGKGNVGQHITPESFQIALTETLKRSNLFGDNLNKAIKIDAQIIEATFPSAGFVMTSILNVQYRVYDPSTENVILDKLVAYKSKATPGEEFFGSARSLLAFQRGIQGHFDILLHELNLGLK